jgi:ferredoxin-NADP reductase
MPTSDTSAFRISHVTRASVSTRLVRVDLRGTPFAYAPGQAATVGVLGQHGAVPYSIASAPEETRQHGSIDFLIKIEASGRWGHRFDRLARGMRLTLSSAFGTFSFPARPPEQRFLFIAGGTGIAPIRSMLRHIELAGVEGRARVLYSARTPHDFPFLSELRRMVRERGIELTLTATREFSPRWRGERGRIGASLLAPLVDHPETLCFVCGPATMVADVPLMLVGLGVAPARIRLEDW